MSYLRHLAQYAQGARENYPAILISGPRQSGKTTFARTVFDDLPYVNLESPLERADFGSDPIGFLARFPNGAILDEVQHTPDLLSYLQVRIDEDCRMGSWILTGSQQIELIRETSQSLAGRVSAFELLPFAHSELGLSPRQPQSIDQAVFQGGYPPLYDDARNLEPTDWFENYLATFVQRDVRAVLDTRNPAAFDRFLRVCATRTGQEINKSSLANDCEVTHKTIGLWLNALEACYVIRTLRSHHRNFGKRMVKRPKLYFLDSGLACRLLQISSAQQLATHPLRGALFETWCFTEVVKHFAHRGQRESLWYWRSQDGIEVDLLLERGRSLIPIEIKANQTPNAQASAGVKKLQKLGERDNQIVIEKGLVLYGGTETRTGSSLDFIPWHLIGESLESLE